MRFRRLLPVLTGLCGVLGLIAHTALADDTGLTKGGASYLQYSVGSRAIGMGHAQTAVVTEDASTLHANSALPALQSAHTVSFTAASLGLDRSLYFAGYVFPFHFSESGSEEGFSDFFEGMEFTPSEQRAVMRPVRSPDAKIAERVSHSEVDLLKDIDTDWESELNEAPARRRWKNPLTEVNSTHMAISAGMTYLGVSDIEGRSEFGAREANFQDSEKTIFLEYSARPYDNLAMGFGGKYYGQTLQSASAHGYGFDLGVWYGVPYISRGRLAVALSGKDLGGHLSWTVPDPTLDTEFSYDEKVLSKWILGSAYTTARERWLFAMDLVHTSQQKTRLQLGLEWRATPAFHLRAGASHTNPTTGLGCILHREAVDLQLDYAYEYDLHALASPHWITLTVRFLPRHKA